MVLRDTDLGSLQLLGFGPKGLRMFKVQGVFRGLGWFLKGQGSAVSDLALTLVGG